MTIVLVVQLLDAMCPDPSQNINQKLKLHKHITPELAVSVGVLLSYYICINMEFGSIGIIEVRLVDCRAQWPGAHDRVWPGLTTVCKAFIKISQKKSDME